MVFQESIIPYALPVYTLLRAFRCGMSPVRYAVRPDLCIYRRSAVGGYLRNTRHKCI
jgi:hypothetical protein